MVALAAEPPTGSGCRLSLLDGVGVESVESPARRVTEKSMGRKAGVSPNAMGQSEIYVQTGKRLEKIGAYNGKRYKKTVQRESL
jgi:hypothetical protein